MRIEGEKTKNLMKSRCARAILFVYNGELLKQEPEEVF